MIEIHNLEKRFPSGRARGRRVVWALRDISLQVPAGAVWALVGPNGAGKTTLFGTLLGFLRPTRGRLTIAGLAPREYTLRHGAGYLPERFALPAGWPLGSALAALARLEGSPGDAATRAGAALRRLGLEEYARRPVGSLSRGLLQRAGLAQALLAPHHLVVLDEPTEGLDPYWRIRLRDIVADFRASGTTVLMASHDLAEVERLADRAVLLDRGVIRDILDLTPTDRPTAYRLRLQNAEPAIGEIFPGATSPGEGTGDYQVTVRDAADLSSRLAALLDLGVIIIAVEPAGPPLEERVRRALEGDS